jgi:hypothetical protein
VADVTRMPLGQAVAGLNQGVRKPKPAIWASIRDDTPEILRAAADRLGAAHPRQAAGLRRIGAEVQARGLDAADAADIIVRTVCPLWFDGPLAWALYDAVLELCRVADAPMPGGLQRAFAARRRAELREVP